MDSNVVTNDHIVSVQPDENEWEMAKPQPNYSENSNSIREEDHDYTWTQPYIEAMERNDWESFKNCFHVHQSDGSRRVNEDGETLLHVAVRIQNSSFVSQLLELMHPKDLELKDKYGYTTLSLVAISGTKDMAEALVKKNTDLVLVRTEVISDHEEQLGDDSSAEVISDHEEQPGDDSSASKKKKNKVRKQHEELPVVTAARNRNIDVVRYLYWKTDTNQFSQDKGKDGATLLTRLITSNVFDIASDLLKKWPILAITEDSYGSNVVTLLARNPSAFPSGRQHDDRWLLLKRILGLQTQPLIL